jgi:hypothetical protein
MALSRLRKQCRIITVTSTQPLLGGVAEISDEFGVPRTTVSMWDARRGTNGFPEPVERLRMGHESELGKLLDRLPRASISEEAPVAVS